MPGTYTKVAHSSNDQMCRFDEVAVAIHFLTHSLKVLKRQKPAPMFHEKSESAIRIALSLLEKKLETFKVKWAEQVTANMIRPN
jgi:hypothetical protein